MLSTSRKYVTDRATSVAFFACAGFDFALMLKTNFNAPPTDAGKLESDAGKHDIDAAEKREQLSQLVDCGC